MIDITYNGQIIALISVGLSIMSTLVRIAVMDREKMDEQKQKMKFHQDSMKEAQKQKDSKAMQKHNEALLEIMSQQMKHSFKPMIFTMIPFLIVFGWLKQTYDGVGAVASIFDYDLGWFGWYFLTSLITSIILNKFFKLT